MPTTSSMPPARATACGRSAILNEVKNADDIFDAVGPRDRLRPVRYS